jgi:exosortase/archaeosortase family protein
LFDHGVVTEGTVIYGSYSLQIVKNCDAADINIVFTSALLALPGALLRKLPLLLAGIAALVVANVGRICSLYFIGAHAPAWFKLAHEEVWPLLLVALTVCVFLGCVHRLQQESPAAEATAAAGEAR